MVCKLAECVGSFRKGYKCMVCRLGPVGSGAQHVVGIENCWEFFERQRKGGMTFHFDMKEVAICWLFGENDRFFTEK